MLWIVLGLTLLVWNGLDDLIALLMLDCQGQQCERMSRGVAQAYCAFCLTLLVVAWPIVLMEMSQGGQER
jgi:hypothetical protein